MKCPFCNGKGYYILSLHSEPPHEVCPHCVNGEITLAVEEECNEKHLGCTGDKNCGKSNCLTRPLTDEEVEELEKNIMQAIGDKYLTPEVMWQQAISMLEITHANDIGFLNFNGLPVVIKGE